MTAPTIDEQIAYAKIHAESTAQWLATNPESKPAQTECAMDAAILATLQSIKDAGDGVEPLNVYFEHDATDKLVIENTVNHGGIKERFVSKHDYDTLKAAYKRVCVQRDEFRKDAGHLWNALKDLSFDCDGVTQTQAPQRGTYNATFSVCQSLAGKYQTAEHYQIRTPNQPAIDSARSK